MVVQVDGRTIQSYLFALSRPEARVSRAQCSLTLQSGIQSTAQHLRIGD